SSVVRDRRRARAGRALRARRRTPRASPVIPKGESEAGSLPRLELLRARGRRAPEALRERRRGEPGGAFGRAEGERERGGRRKGDGPIEQVREHHVAAVAAGEAPEIGAALDAAKRHRLEHQDPNGAIREQRLEPLGDAELLQR